MKQGLNYAVFGTVLAITAGLISVYGLDGLSSSQTTGLASAPILGHVTYIHKDMDGNVISYRQSDNVITNAGENCVAAYLFNVDSTGTNATCTAAQLGVGNFRTIAIGNGSNSATAVQTDFRLADEHTFAGGMDRFTVPSNTLTGANFTEASGTGGTGVQVVLAAEFTNDASPSQTLNVDESGIFNGTNLASDTMFARQSFTAIPLDNGESLTVEWTINIGGTGNALGSEPN